MEYDYYEILGVSPSASLAEIRTAYRAQAQKCHPDRGGTHARMIRINEAWRVLSDSTLRPEYDDLRARQANAAESAAFAQGVQSARAQAGEYPRDWASFESWLANITRDFTSAEYGSSKSAGIEMATVSKSVSGWVVVNLSGLAGAIVGVLIVTKMLGWETRYLDRGRLAIIAAGFGVGTMVGVRIHQALRSLFNEVAQPNTESRKVVTQCPTCGQKLRVPQSPQELVVTCKSCRKQFPFGPI